MQCGTVELFFWKNHGLNLFFTFFSCFLNSGCPNHFFVICRKFVQTKTNLMIQISIPVKKHVKKYLIKKYGEIHTISKKTFLGLLLLELISTEADTSDIDFNGFDRYKIDIPELYFNTKGYTINRNKLKFLGVCLERLFFEDFYAFVDVELAKGKTNAWQSVELFLNMNDINENEMKLGSMYRNYQRHCGEKIKEKKLNAVLHS